MSNCARRRIAIIGAGFSGTATAIQLMRQAADQTLDVLLIERGPTFGRGLAYAENSFPYILNVPASRMSAFSQHPDDFLMFAQRKNPRIAGEDFLPRSLYGDYLNDHLETAVAASDGARGSALLRAGGPRLEKMRGEAIDIQEQSAPAGPTVILADGRRILCERVVLASGLQPPRIPDSVRCDIEAPVLRRNPWSAGRLLPSSSRLLILGSGLTMADVVCEAVARHPDVEIHAISRHGLMPADQTAFHADSLRDDALSVNSARSTRRLVSAIRSLSNDTNDRRGDWREVITLARRLLPQLWARLSVVERRRFQRHVQSYWDIHRHRLPGAVHSRLGELRASGQLTIHAGRIHSLTSSACGACAAWVPRGSRDVSTIEAAEVVNCTGPDYDLTRSSDALWRSLMRRGIAVPDELRLGVRTSENGALIERRGNASDRIFYVGPMLRADYWEATAVAELRLHSERLAGALLKLAFK